MLARMTPRSSRSLLAVLFSLCAFAFTACGGGSIAGTYQLDKEALKKMAAQESGDADKLEDAARKMMDAMFDKMEGTMELNADGTASVKFAMPPMGEQAFTGSWKADGNKVTITAKGENGKEESKTGTFADGAITIEEEMGPKKMTMVFRRK